jgi:hypothetical protein
VLCNEERLKGHGACLLCASCAPLVHGNDTWLMAVSEAHSKDPRTQARFPLVLVV